MQIRNRIPVELMYFLIAGISIAGLYGVVRLRFDFHFSDYFVQNDPSTKAYEEFRNTFNPETEENAILIGIPADSGIFNPDFLNKLAMLTQSLSSMETVDKVYSLSNTFVYALREGNWKVEPLIHTDQHDAYAKDSAYIYASAEYRKFLLSRSGNSTLVTVFLKPFLSETDQVRIVQEVDKRVSSIAFTAYHISSKSKLIDTYIKELKKNMRMFIIMTALTLGMCMLWMYGSIQFVALSFLIITLSVLWTLGLSYYVNVPFDFLGSLLAPAIATITMTGILHIRQYYDHYFVKHGHSNISRTDLIHGVGKAVFLTSLTTAIGFLSFDSSKVVPLHNFGRLAACGIGIGLILSLFFLYRRIPGLQQTSGMTGLWTKIFEDKRINVFYSALIQQRKTAGFLFAGIVVWAAIQIPQMELNGSLISEIPQNSTAFKDTKFIEEEFGGSRSFEMVLSTSKEKETFVDLKNLKVANELVQYLEDSLNLSFVISPISMLKAANKAFSGGASSFYKLPENQDSLDLCLRAIEQTQYGQDLRRFLSENKTQFRISGLMPEVSIKEYQVLEKKLKSYYGRIAGHENVGYSITGASHVLDRTPQYLVGNMLYSLVLAYVLLACIAWYYLRNWIAIPIAIVPNLLPLIIVAGIMAQFKIYLKIDTAILFPIALGMAVDNTIHFFHRLKEHSKIQNSFQNALQHSFVEVFKPVTLNMFVLIAGFSALLFSSFSSAQKIGIMLCSSLVLAWACNVILLPVLFEYFAKYFKK